MLQFVIPDSLKVHSEIRLKHGLNGRMQSSSGMKSGERGVSGVESCERSQASRALYFRRGFV